MIIGQGTDGFRPVAASAGQHYRSRTETMKPSQGCSSILGRYILDRRLVGLCSNLSKISVHINGMVRSLIRSFVLMKQNSD